MVTASDSNSESGFSNEAHAILDKAPGDPTGLKIATIAVAIRNGVVESIKIVEVANAK